MDDRGSATERLHILVGAYACNPTRGSEEAVGWEWVNAIAMDHRVTVLTAAFHRADIERVPCPHPNLRFEYVPHRPWHYAPTPVWRRIEGSVLKPIMNLAYVQWLGDAKRIAEGLIASEPFDLVHQLTYVGFRFPGGLWKCGLPFVWGPLGGLENTAWRLLPAMGVRGGAYYAGRNLINSAQRRYLRSPRRALAAAGPGVIAATGSIRRALARSYGVESTVISEVSAPVHLSPEQPLRRGADEPLRLIWSGQHLPGKALNLLLEALARIPRTVPWHLDILGDGPSRVGWQRASAVLGIESRCTWHGHLSRDDALRAMSQSHLLAISSLKDLTSTVLLEGLSLGLPVLCPDHCGFSDVVTEKCGVAVSAASTESIVAGFAQAIPILAANEDRRVLLAANALLRAKEYTSHAKRSQLNGIYGAVLKQRMVSRFAGGTVSDRSPRLGRGNR